MVPHGKLPLQFCSIALAVLLLQCCSLQFATLWLRTPEITASGFWLCIGCRDNPRKVAELCTWYCTHRVISDKVHRLLVTLSCFWPDRFVQLLSLIPMLILLLCLLVSIDQVYTGLRELFPD